MDNSQKPEIVGDRLYERAINLSEINKYKEIAPAWGYNICTHIKIDHQNKTFQFVRVASLTEPNKTF